MSSSAEPFIEEIAERVFQKIERHIQNQSIFGDRLTFTESEAAELLGCPKHVLKGCRERGKIKPVKVGKCWKYSRELLTQFANRGEVN